MRYPRNAKIFRGQLDAAPFVGVFFLLVIFLVLQSSLVFMPGVKVTLDLPEAQNLPGTSNPTIVVAADREKQLYYGNQVISASELKTVLKAQVARYREQGADLTLVVQADKAVAFEVVVQLAQMAQEAGVKEILQATRPALVPVGPPTVTSTNKGNGKSPDKTGKQ